MRSLDQHIIITNIDLERLQPVIEQHDTPASDSLEDELARAVVVDQRAVPGDVVTMNSDVVYEDLDTGVRRKVKVVYPKDADAPRGHVSVLAPIGSALLGLRVGQTIEWTVPNGTRRVRVIEIPYQPEASGDYAL
ncbi:MAG: nucleoside diphosphate kinase regulator [Kofleriaceae bacterium]|nr:nucleoside diphosphate kinase regulator [Kofleriaceae bacterium]